MKAARPSDGPFYLCGGGQSEQVRRIQEDLRFPLPPYMPVLKNSKSAGPESNQFQIMRHK